MAPIETPVEGKNALTDWLIDATKATLTALPDDVLEKLRECIKEPSPVVATVNAAELIYARADDLPPDLLAIGAELATMTATFGFHGMAEEGRGHGMAKALKSREGVKAALPEAVEPKEPPEPKVDFLPADKRVPPVSEGELPVAPGKPATPGKPNP